MRFSTIGERENVSDVGVFGTSRLSTARVVAASFWVEGWYWTWEEIVCWVWTGLDCGGERERGRRGEIACYGAKVKECVGTVWEGWKESRESRRCMICPAVLTVQAKNSFV